MRIYLFERGIKAPYHLGNEHNFDVTKWAEMDAFDRETSNHSWEVR
jgi:hypothetical protein